MPQMFFLPNGFHDYHRNIHIIHKKLSYSTKCIKKVMANPIQVMVSLRTNKVSHVFFVIYVLLIDFESSKNSWWVPYNDWTSETLVAVVPNCLNNQSRPCKALCNRCLRGICLCLCISVFVSVKLLSLSHFCLCHTFVSV